MNVYIFRGPGRLFGFTQAADGANLPSTLGDWAPFKMVELTRGAATPGVDADACLDDIQAHGFHLTDAHERVTERGLA